MHTGNLLQITDHVALLVRFSVLIFPVCYFSIFYRFMLMNFSSWESVKGKLIFRSLP